MVTFFAKLLKILNSEDSPVGIGWGIALAFWFALLPLFSVAKWAILIVVALLRVNLSAFLVFSAVFSILAWALDPLAHELGVWLLSHPGMQDFWTTIMSSSIAQGLALNNSLGLATFLLGVVLLLPMFLFGRWLVTLYREKLKSRFEQWRVVQLFKASKVYQLYQAMS